MYLQHIKTSSSNYLSFFLLALAIVNTRMLYIYISKECVVLLSSLVNLMEHISRVNP